MERELGAGATLQKLSDGLGRSTPGEGAVVAPESPDGLEDRKKDWVPACAGMTRERCPQPLSRPSRDAAQSRDPPPALCSDHRDVAGRSRLSLRSAGTGGKSLGFAAQFAALTWAMLARVMVASLKGGGGG